MSYVNRQWRFKSSSRFLLSKRCELSNIFAHLAAYKWFLPAFIWSPNSHLTRFSSGMLGCSALKCIHNRHVWNEVPSKVTLSCSTHSLKERDNAVYCTSNKRSDNLSQHKNDEYVLNKDALCCSHLVECTYQNVFSCRSWSRL